MTIADSQSTRQRLIALVVCAAPPARGIGDLVDLLIRDGWQVNIVATPTAMAWIDTDDLEARTAAPVRSQPRDPGTPSSSPDPDVVVVAPATFNTINKWAAGINDTLALGLLNDALGAHIPVIVSPYAKGVLTAHPAFERNLDLLRSCGAHLTATEALRPDADDGPFRWHAVIDVVRQAVA